ncbi:MAG: hypothetical protein K6A41_09940 [Bacteroidales bacterium]|nr:hypothetical protein [Bacteroidales bacterium]
MKKTFCLLAVLVVGALVFSSCQKEGQYLPKQKISRIEYQAYYSSDLGSVSVTNEVQDWEWTDKLLSKITYRYANGTTFGYLIPEYDSKKRIEKIHGVLDDDAFYYTFTYDGKYLTRIQAFEDGALETDYVFVKNDGKTVEITVTEWDKKDAESKSINPLQFVFTPEVAECIKPTDEKGTVVYKLTWDGNNISNITAVKANGDEMSVQKFQYDDCINPFKGFLSNEAMSAMSDLYSENNVVLSNHVLHMTLGDITTNLSYAYEYDGKYPVKKTWSTQSALGTNISHIQTITYQ